VDEELRKELQMAKKSAKAKQGKSFEELFKEQKNPKNRVRYAPYIPRKVPDGWIVAHNNVRPESFPEHISGMERLLGLARTP
jgi:hypothetical protein